MVYSNCCGLFAFSTSIWEHHGFVIKSFTAFFMVIFVRLFVGLARFTRYIPNHSYWASLQCSRPCGVLSHFWVESTSLRREMPVPFRSIAVLMLTIQLRSPSCLWLFATIWEHHPLFIALNNTLFITVFKTIWIGKSRSRLRPIWLTTSVQYRVGHSCHSTYRDYAPYAPLPECKVSTRQ